jgi:transcriptional regulator with GAF, ATPase, and Fis domain
MEFLRSANPNIAAQIEDRNSNPPAPAQASGMHALRNPLSDRTALEATLTECGWNISEAARRLGTTRAQVYRWMERLGIQTPRARGN